MTNLPSRSHRNAHHSLYRTALFALALPALADTLGLSDRQIEALTEMREAFTEVHRAHRKRMQEGREAFRELFASENLPPVSEVQHRLTEVATRRAEGQADLYERVLEMHEVLTRAQRRVLAHVTPRDLHCQMRRHMTRAEEQRVKEAVRDVATPGLSDERRRITDENTEDEGASGEDAPGPRSSFSAESFLRTTTRS